MPSDSIDDFHDQSIEVSKHFGSFTLFFQQLVHLLFINGDLLVSMKMFFFNAVRWNQLRNGVSPHFEFEVFGWIKVFFFTDDSQELEYDLLQSIVPSYDVFVENEVEDHNESFHNIEGLVDFGLYENKQS